MNLVLKDKYDSWFDALKMLMRLVAVMLMLSEAMVSVPLFVSHGRRI